MRELAIRVRQGANRLPGRPVAIAAAAGAVLLLLTALLLANVPPVYAVQLDGRPVAEGRDLEALGAALEQQAQARLDQTVSLRAREHVWTYSLWDLGLEASPEHMPGALRQAAGRLHWHQRLPWSRPTLNVALDGRWNEERLTDALVPVRITLEREPVPASLTVSERTPTITPEVNGLTLDMHGLADALRGLGNRSELDLPLTERQPAVTRASLEAMRVAKLVAEWSTEYDPTIPRADNVERAARAFNGVMLAPGELLSYNAVVGPVDAANGWKEAYVIVAGELVPGVGGGVCQVATTLYGAALRANLEIVERHQHQLAVTYIEPSQDAAIAQGYEDLKIRNTTLGHLYIETEAGGGRVTFRLYGDLPAGQTVKIESVVLDSQPYPTRTVVDPEMEPGRQVVKIHGNPGLVSEAYRAVYNDGQLVKRERLSRDSYLPTAQVVVEGPPPPVPAAVTDPPASGTTAVNSNP